MFTTPRNRSILAHGYPSSLGFEYIAQLFVFSPGIDHGDIPQIQEKKSETKIG